MQYKETTLDNCADEPIHIPGSIQSHGFLVIIGQDDCKILQVSENLSDLISLPVTEIIGLSIEKVFGKELADHVTKRVDYKFPEREEPFIWEIKINGEVKSYLIDINKQDDTLLLDIEPNSTVMDLDSFYQNLRGLVERLSYQDYETEDNIFQETVIKTRELTGYDRVMLYRFDADYNGQVVAEDKKDSLNSFLHQHFPESDIPTQARKLYLQNPIRVLVDVQSEPSILIPESKRYDLSKSSLRSVSPMHIQYLKNMGVNATMSISIIVHGRLWGLIACHHYSFHYIPQKIRQAAAFLGQIVSYLLNAVLSVKMGIKEGAARELNGILAERLVQEADLHKALKSEVSNLLKLVNADGVAWKLDDTIHKYGSTPSKKGIEKMADYIWKNSNSIYQYHTDRLPEIEPEFSQYAVNGSGILALLLSKQDDFYMIWFRKEVIETKKWGGKPEKVIEFTDDGSHRLMPRSSFKLWKENVKYRSEQWDETEISITLRFRNSLMNYVVLRTEQIKRINKELEKRVKSRTKELNKEISERKKTERKLKEILKEAQQSNEDLEQFAYIASHDLQEPLRKIQTFGDRLTQVNQDLDGKSKDYLDRMVAAAGRMQTLIQNLLSYSRVNVKANPFVHTNLQSIVENVLSDLQILIEKNEAVVEVHLDRSIDCDEGQMNRLFQNLIQNAIKFRAKDRVPEVTISIAEEDDEFLTIQCADNGIGIEGGYESKIFELFSRLHGRSAYEGTGLGLAICKKIVARHNGDIWAESKSKEGTTFYIKLQKNQ